MRTSPEKPTRDEDDLDLPDLDGEDDGSPEMEGAMHELDVEIDDHASSKHENPLDDSTGEDAPIEEIAVEGTEAGWLIDAENAGTLDVGPFDVSIEPEGAAGKVLGDDEAEDAGHGAEDLVSGDETLVVDGGEEGPTDEDEELREEDLPALDADEDGDVSDDELYDRGLLTVDEDLRWDDRAWDRVASEAIPSTDTEEARKRELEVDDSGLLAMPSDDGTPQSARDITWKRLEESGRVMAAAFVPGDSVVVALGTGDRSRALLVRVQPDGEARIIAEVDPRTLSSSKKKSNDEDDDGEVCVVTFVRWDAGRGCLFVGGNFGVEAYRPVMQ